MMIRTTSHSKSRTRATQYARRNRLRVACTSISSMPKKRRRGTEEEEEKKKRVIVLDGANLAWNLGHALAKRYNCTPRPLSYGIVEALRNFESEDATVCVFVPHDLVEGTMFKVADGMRASSAETAGDEYELHTDEKLELISSADASPKLWRNHTLSSLVDSGVIQSIQRGDQSSRDDVALIRFARQHDALIVSNDVFRDHGRRCTQLSKRHDTNESALLGFSTKKEFKRFMANRRIGFEWRVHGPPTSMYPPNHPIRVAASRNDLAAIPELFAAAATASAANAALETKIASLTQLSRFAS